MAKVACQCPLALDGKRQLHGIACPNRKRGKNRGPTPQRYGRIDPPRVDYARARLALDALRCDVERVRDFSGMYANPAICDAVTGALLQCEVIRRHLDGE